MTLDEILEAVEQILSPKQLGAIERFVLSQSWKGQTYSEMAKEVGYGSEYIKEIGYHLWQSLSEALGERVTKKNLHLAIGHYQETKLSAWQRKCVGELTKNSPVEKLLVNSAIASEIEFPSGPVPLGSPFYINRSPIEESVYAEIRQIGCFIRIKAPRRMGKTSLLNRIVAQAKIQGYKTVYLDFQEADEAVLSDLDKLLRWFCANISRQLHLLPKLDDYWDVDMGSKVSCKIYFQEYLLPHICSPVLLALNEVNRVFAHPQIAQDFLPMLRFWHELTKQELEWQQLRFAIVHTTEIYIPLKLNQSPFNIGLAIALPQFKPEQVQDLAGRYGLAWASGEAGAQRLASLQAMVGGHPYLLSLAFYHLRQRKITLEALLHSAPTPAGIYSHHLRENLAILRSEPELAVALQAVVSTHESVPLEAIAAYKLESMGLVKVEGNQARPSCQLYRLYFNSQLGEKSQLTANRFNSHL